MRNSATVLRLGGALLAVAVLAAALTLLFQKPERRHLTAYFTKTVGLYEGADVRILGIPVGEVTGVEPVGDSVRVELSYDAKYKVPANAQAVIVSQTLVADRYVQLTPVYKGGAVLPDDATLTVSRTAVPVEVDEIGGNLNELSKALGPQGANAPGPDGREGSLSRLLGVGAANLDGQGDDIRQTIADTSKALGTLSTDRGDIAETIKNLRIITEAMKANDQQIKSFTGHLNAVSGQLAGEKEELSAALNTLAPTLRNVQRFVRDNRGELAANVRQLAQITGVLVKEKEALAEILTAGPLAVSNLTHAYDPISGTIHTRNNFRQFHDLADWLCSLAYSVGTPARQCLNLVRPVNGIGEALTGFSLDLSWITALTTHYDPVPVPPDAYGPSGRPPDRKRPKGITALLPGGAR
ncbi:phospholipid/cholesterol/gamma-HCH transport system substrate-binding protein [Actinomadura pelletieri DSM 43383]|uniref:Phospholipid/cholesterol/gamma-HCH transport system substrate-binding protein n=1 Tax=Actinomadura pelletieri DSM 43383 TaxID=1120940 RepID=A0A495QRF6_9ACTN|nr:MCE family protein [Actinomadura pelletieri]RKS76069.1 phospholipid/cholesterol/gamma-HCH transport system substrate-binding protein [Actinomadura pelletieri DSM 43383]